ncbi:hypothetical protein BC831DRAFT_514174 [Entophlyctis helioformis]|nr:hypothetical protein BC831DRAFT_514174 [Entophlyctis helioformis]
MRGRLVDSIILDRWVPPEKLPFPYNKANAAVVWERIKKFIFATWSVYQVRTTVKGWKPGPFGLETQRMYIEMNKAFAKGDKNELSKYVSDGMLAKLNPEIKSMQRLGEYVWEAHGAATRPHVVHLATAKVALENGEQRLSQVTVRLDVKQSMAIYKNGKLIGGNPNEHKTIVEYVVMEKWLDGRWAETNWKIAGKIPAPSQQASSA